MIKRRVVVTGCGIISPLGNSISQAWDNALKGKSGIRTIEEFDTSEYNTKIAGLISNFNVEEYMSLKESRKCDIFIQYGIAASVQAIKMAGLDSAVSIDKSRIGVIIGSGIGGLTTISETQDLLQKSGPKRISPFFIPASIINMISGHISIMFGFQGPNLAVATACTTGTHSIGLAARTIAYNDADIMIAGGAEKASSPLGMAGFAAARALSSRNDEPTKASRPWDKDRDGFILGDGAGALVLEEYEHAKQRGANIIAEIVGFGMSGDAFHITRPGENGAARAMWAALKDANLQPSDIDYINAHGTSTQVGDLEENRAIKLVFENHAKKLSVSSTKSMTGHLLGAAGAVEAIFTVLAIRDKIAPPTINLDNPDEGCDLDYVPHVAKAMPIRAAMSNSFGFGGTNGTLIFKKITE